MSARHLIYSNSAISIPAAIEAFPTLAATAPHASRSDRYKLISTADVLRGLESENFHVHGIQVSRVRDETKRGFEKHIIRMRRPLVGAPTEAPEIVLINSHDGASPYVLFAGIIRFICSNGIVAGERFESVRVAHRGDIAANVIEGTYRVVDNFGAVTDRIDAYKAHRLTHDESAQFAIAAHKIRFPDQDKAPVSPESFLAARRFEDQGDSLWNVFNRVQENAIRGGMRSLTRTENGRTRSRTARAVTGIDSTIDVNRRLFDLADSFLTGQTIEAIAA